MGAPHLTDLERLAMERVWASGEATVRAVLESLNEDRSRAPRAYTTVLTIMQRLEAKGMLARRPGDGPVVFRPAIARDVYLGACVVAEVSRLVEDFGELALVLPLVACLVALSVWPALVSQSSFPGDEPARVVAEGFR